MSVANLPYCRVRWRFHLGMIPWYRSFIALVFGGGVMLIALWAIEQGSGPWMILGVAGMAFVALLLIFGVEIDTIEIDAIGLSIDFSNTTVSKTNVLRHDNDSDDSDE